MPEMSTGPRGLRVGQSSSGAPARCKRALGRLFLQTFCFCLLPLANRVCDALRAPGPKAWFGTRAGHVHSKPIPGTVQACPVSHVKAQSSCIPSHCVLPGTGGCASSRPSCSYSLAPVSLAATSLFHLHHHYCSFIWLLIHQSLSVSDLFCSLHHAHSALYALPPLSFYRIPLVLRYSL